MDAYTVSVCLPACLPVRLPAYMPACMPAHLPTPAHLAICMGAYLLPALLHCLPACLSACMSACMSACLPACLSVCLPVCLLVCLSACMSVRLPSCLPACLPASRSVCLAVCLPTCLPTCLLHSDKHGCISLCNMPAYMLAYLSYVCLPSCLHVCLPTCLPTCPMSVCLPVCMSACLTRYKHKEQAWLCIRPKHDVATLQHEMLQHQALFVIAPTENCTNQSKLHFWFEMLQHHTFHRTKIERSAGGSGGGGRPMNCIRISGMINDSAFWRRWPADELHRHQWNDQRLSIGTSAKAGEFGVACPMNASKLKCDVFVVIKHGLCNLLRHVIPFAQGLFGRCCSIASAHLLWRVVPLFPWVKALAGQLLLLRLRLRHWCDIVVPVTHLEKTRS